MINEFKYGILLENAMKSYKQGDYSGAEKLLSKAVSLKPKDFITLFWMGRTAVVLGEYEQAKEYLIICSQLRPDLKQELIGIWISQVDTDNSEIIVSSTLVEKDLETDKRLETYNNEYKFSLKDLVIFCFPFYIGSTLIRELLFQLVSQYHFSQYGSLLILDSMQLLVLIAYIRYKTTLPLHPFTQIIKMWQIVKTYMKSFMFIMYAVISCFALKAMIFGTIESSKHLIATITGYQLNMSIFDYIFHAIHSLLFVPSIDSLFYIGIVYNVLIEFKEKLRNVIVILCVFLMAITSIVGSDSFSYALPNGYSVVNFLMVASYYRYKSLGTPIITEMVGELFMILLLMYYKVFV